MSVEKAREVCPHMWMKEALDLLLIRQSEVEQNLDDETPCS